MLRNKKSIFNLLVIFHALHALGCSTSTPFKDRYNLNFSLEHNLFSGWHVNGVGVYRLDSTQLIANKAPLCIEQHKDIPLRISLSQTVKIPLEKQNKSVVVSLNSKSQHIKHAVLKIVAFDIEENILYKDSVISISSEWERKEIYFSGDKIDFINLEILVDGNQNLDDQKIWIDKISITIDNKDINSFPEQETKANYILKTDSIFLYPETRVDLFKDKKIIAFGESAHGCTGIEELILKSIKELIIKEECRLILLEMPIDKCLLWNAFVEGRCSSEFIDIIKDDMQASLLSTEVFVDFLLWLREYNTKNNQKVNFIGIDCINDMTGALFFTTYSLFYYFYSLYNDNTKSKLRPVLKNLFERNFTDVYEEIISKKTYWEVLLGKKNYDLLVYTLGIAKDSLKENIDIALSILKRENRDYTLFINVRKILDIYQLKSNEKAVIFAHFNHTNKLNNTSIRPLNKSLGYYLSSEYKNNYCSVGVFVGGGHSIVPELGNRSANAPLYRMGSAPENSIEAVCLNKTKESNFIMPVGSLPEKTMRYRALPSVGIYSFPYGYMPKRTDYILFIPENVEKEAKSVDFELLRVRGVREIRVKKIVEKNMK
ncbi:hypothetical protein FACS1894179_08460 [Bacteroidia bacterium]|nr:hypothetical protein FACS1894179_08460 [Bacteroidia bacterium]